MRDKTIIAIFLVTAGMLGLYFKIEYSVLVLFFGFIFWFNCIGLIALG